MKIKKLKEILNQFCNDDMNVVLEYNSWCELELEKGDCFNVDDYSVTDKALYLEF